MSLDGVAIAYAAREAAEDDRVGRETKAPVARDGEGCRPQVGGAVLLIVLSPTESGISIRDPTTANRVFLDAAST